MRPITLLNPRRLVFGNDCIRQFEQDFVTLGHKRLLLLCAPPIVPLIHTSIEFLRTQRIHVIVDDSIVSEPEIDTLETLLSLARQEKIDSVVGVGGGSVLDVSKLVAALHNSTQSIRDVFGIGKLKGRSTYLACLPTTAGTGSEVSPNAILLDPADQLKKGVVSPHLVPDASYVDPVLACSVPAAVTATTGMDALTHCIEAYTNRYAHPMIDLYALEGIRLIYAHLEKAVHNGNDREARANLALASMYGGICLGPVNTAAVHALAYPLGGEFHIAHGLSNAILLPHVMTFNIQAVPERYAKIARVLGCKTVEVTKAANEAAEKAKALSKACGIPAKMRELGIPETAIPGMAEGALQVTRLLKNNPRPVTLEDAQTIYEQAF